MKDPVEGSQDPESQRESGQMSTNTGRAGFQGLISSRYHHAQVLFKLAFYIKTVGLV